MAILCDNKIILLLSDPDGNIIRFFSHEPLSIFQYFQDVSNKDTSDFTKENVKIFNLTDLKNISSIQTFFKNESTPGPENG